MSCLQPELAELWRPEVFQVVFGATVDITEEEGGRGEIKKKPTAQVDSQEEGRCNG